MPSALLILHRKRVFDDEAVLELTLWRVPNPVRGSAHPFKYSLFYGRPGERTVLYDNEAGKGNHRHFGAREEPYSFVTPEQLIQDFLADVKALRGSYEK
jgi:hypothetical protein